MNWSGRLYKREKWPSTVGSAYGGRTGRKPRSSKSPQIFSSIRFFFCEYQTGRVMQTGTPGKVFFKLSRNAAVSSSAFLIIFSASFTFGRPWSGGPRLPSVTITEGGVFMKNGFNASCFQTVDGTSFFKTL